METTTCGEWWVGEEYGGKLTATVNCEYFESRRQHSNFFGGEAVDDRIVLLINMDSRAMRDM